MSSSSSAFLGGIVVGAGLGVALYSFFASSKATDPADADKLKAELAKTKEQLEAATKTYASATSGKSAPATGSAASSVLSPRLDDPNAWLLDATDVTDADLVPLVEKDHLLRIVDVSSWTDDNAGLLAVEFQLEATSTEDRLAELSTKISSKASEDHLFVLNGLSAANSKLVGQFVDAVATGWEAATDAGSTIIALRAASGSSVPKMLGAGHKVWSANMLK